MKFTPASGFLLGAIAACLLTSCASSDEVTTQQNPKSSEATPVAAAPAFTPPLGQANASPGLRPPAAPPNQDEVKRAVARIFDKTAVAEVSLKSSFVAGDFNGDGSEDLAVLIKPNDTQLGEINNELANWVLEDPKNVTPRTNQRTAPPRAHAEKDEILLAVIHGVGTNGWRNPEAKQTYVLKNQGATNMTAQTPTSAQTTYDKRVALRGDVIGESINGKSGILYWNGGKYAWYPTASK